MKYRIVFAHDTNELETDVNIFMENGWKPIGGLVISKQDTETHYFQTMITAQHLNRQALLDSQK